MKQKAHAVTCATPKEPGSSAMQPIFVVLATRTTRATNAWACKGCIGFVCIGVRIECPGGGAFNIYLEYRFATTWEAASLQSDSHMQNPNHPIDKLR